MIYVFDIDGTLADCTHRLHLIEGKKRDYEAFHKACVDDKPIKPMVELCNVLGNQGTTIIFVSARPESTREQTANWLWANLDLRLYYDIQEFRARLYLRADGDYRCDSLVKPELMSRVIEDYGVSKGDVVIFEDRKRVVDAYRQAGYVVCDVAGQDY